jgi:hypothetical protein
LEQAAGSPSFFRLNPVLTTSVVLKELSAFSGFGEALLRDLRQPEYIHVLLNPLPVYGLLVGWVGLLIALVLRSRRAQIATLTLVLLSSVSAWPVYEFGQQGYDRVLSMADEDGQAWLDEHEARAEKLIYIFYLLVAFSAIAITVPFRWPKSSVPLAVAVILLGAVTLGTGGYIGYAGGRVRHREFRNEPPPPRDPKRNPSSATASSDG